MENLGELKVIELKDCETVKHGGGFLPLALLLVADAAILGYMGGYLYESFTSDH